MKKLEKIIKEAIAEVINEDAAKIKNLRLTATKFRQQAIDAEQAASAEEEKDLQQNKTAVAEINVNEMARIPVQYKIADLSKLDDLSDKVKNSKGVQGIISYLQDKGQAPVAAIAKDQFNRPQQAINPVVLALTQAGVLDTVGGSGVAASRVGKGGAIAPPTTKQIIDPEDFLIGGGEKFDKASNEPSDEEIAASFAAARAIGDEDEDIIKTLPKDAPKSKMTISDQDYDKLMKFLNAKERLRNIDSALRQNKKISRGGDDMISKDSNEEERLKAKKVELEKRIDDLVASSEYLQRRKAPEDKNKRFTESFKTMAALNFELMAGNIGSIILPTGETVADREQIKEFVQNADSKLIREIEDGLTTLRQQGTVKPLKFKSSEEQIKDGAPATYEVPITFDNSNFFV
jgi:hypothetical protein